MTVFHNLEFALEIIWDSLFSMCNTHTYFPYLSVLLGALCSVQWPNVDFGTISTILPQILYYKNNFYFWKTMSSHMVVP